VYVHAASPDGEEARELRIPEDREAVRARATALSLHTLRHLLTRCGTDAREPPG
jgi:nicotinamide mononucleotide (NMN) deamidase PncC